MVSSLKIFATFCRYLQFIWDYWSLLKELCSKLFSDEICDKEISVKQVASIIGGYAFSSKSYIDNGKYKIVTIGNVTGAKYISGEYNSIDELPENLQKQQILSKGDILISLTGNVGRISIVSGENYLLNQRVAKLHISDSLLKEYVYQYLSQSTFEKDMINSGQGAAQKNIKNDDILQYHIRMPADIGILKTIVKLLLVFDKKIINEEKLALRYQYQKVYFLNAMFI